MRIEYENKFSDLLLFNSVHQFLSLTLQGFFLIILGMIFWSELNILNGTALNAGVTALCWYLAIWVIQLFFNFAYLYSRKSRKNDNFITKHIIEIQDEVLYEETKYSKTFAYWPGVYNVVSRPGFVGIYLTPHMAHVIPNRAFNSEAQRTIFLALVKEKILTYKNSKS